MEPYTVRSISDMPNRMRLILKEWVTRVIFSAAAAAIFGYTALLLYSFSYCWNGATDCMAYSPTRRWIAFLLAPPIFLMQRWLFGTVNDVANFDPVLFGKFAWVALWAYYFVIVSAALHLVKRYRPKPAQPAPR
jgi:hypothetical protein